MITLFQEKNNKSYSDPKEDARRLVIFQDSIKMIDAHNEKYKKGEVTWTMGLTHFADLTAEERSKCHGPGLIKK